MLPPRKSAVRIAAKFVCSIVRFVASIPAAHDG
jgi:hypothetical protein